MNLTPDSDWAIHLHEIAFAVGVLFVYLAALVVWSPRARRNRARRRERQRRHELVQRLRAW